MEFKTFLASLPWDVMGVGLCAVLLIAGLRISALSQLPTGFLPKSQSLYSSPKPCPPSPFGSNPSPLPLLPYAPNSLLPPFIPTRAFWTVQVAIPVNHTFRFDSPSTTYTGPIIHCLPPCPFCPSSFNQTSVGPGLLICSAFYTPLPSTNPPTPST